jgi:hypothetical protein
MHGSNFFFWLDPRFWLVAMLVVALVLLGLALLGTQLGPKVPLSDRGRRYISFLCLLSLILILLLALSGCGTRPLPGKPILQQVPAELMQPPGKPILLAPSLPGSTSALPSPTKPPTQPPAEPTERRISA